MRKHFFIGVDGGATKCIVRVEDESGHLLGRESSGPANIRISVEQTWQSIYSALNKILLPHAIELENKNYCFHIGLGLAGCEIESAYQAFVTWPHGFHILKLSSDAHAACLGAHNGEDGAVIIAGTGVVGFQVCAQQITKVAGWGFPYDDEGGGAWLGLEAVKITLQWLDGRLPISGLSKAIYAHFNENLDNLISWANQANSTAFAELAPIIMQQNTLGDPMARQLLKRAAKALDEVWEALKVQQKNAGKFLSCALIGGISSFLQPYLNADLQSRLKPAASPPDVGALWLVRNEMKD